MLSDVGVIGGKSVFNDSRLVLVVEGDEETVSVGLNSQISQRSSTYLRGQFDLANVTATRLDASCRQFITSTPFAIAGLVLLCLSASLLLAVILKLGSEPFLVIRVGMLKVA